MPSIALNCTAAGPATVHNSDAVPQSLSALRRHIPVHCLRPHPGRALVIMLFSGMQMTVALLLAWFVRDRGMYWAYPISYILSSLAFTSLFVIAHDCGHYSFLKSRKAMSFVGHVCMTPLFYPFYAWKYSHDAHHKYTNQLRRSKPDVYFDNAWLPETIGEYDSERKTAPLLAILYRYSRIVLPLASIAHLLGYHYRPSIFRTYHRRNVYFSYLITGTGIASLSLFLYYITDNMYALLHYWLIPALLFHNWMALYTYLHHTAVDIPVHSPENWTPFKAQALGTVNCLWPRWISLLHFNIDVHIPHHVAPNIPCYRLREANAALQASPYGDLLRQFPLTLRYLYTQWKRCHLWNETNKRYTDFNSIRWNRRDRFEVANKKHS